MEYLIIVGASGYLGSHLTKQLSTELRENERIIALYHSKPPPPPPPPPSSSIIYIKYDIANDNSLIDLLQHHKVSCVRVVFNCAAISNVAQCEENASLATKVNQPIPIIDAVVHFRCAFVHISTDQVFSGEPIGHVPYEPSTATSPPTNYGRQKAAFEEIIAASRCTRYVILRPSVIIGRRSPLFNAHETFCHWLVGALHEASEKKSKVSAFANEWRNFTYTNDLVRWCINAYRLMLDENEECRLIANAGGGERTSRAQLALLVAHELFSNDSVAKELIDFKHLTDEERLAFSPRRPSDLAMNSSDTYVQLRHAPTPLVDIVKDIVNELK